jgi:hypothetical protein
MSDDAIGRREFVMGRCLHCETPYRGEFPDDCCAGREVEVLRAENARLRAGVDRAEAKVTHLETELELVRQRHGEQITENEQLYVIIRHRQDEIDWLREVVASRDRTIRIIGDAKRGGGDDDERL